MSVKLTESLISKSRLNFLNRSFRESTWLNFNNYKGQKMEPAGNQKIQQTYPHEELVRNTIEKNPDAKMSEIYSIALKNIANEDEKKSFNENFCVCYHRIRPFNYPSKEESEPYRIIAKMMSETSGRKCYKG